MRGRPSPAPRRIVPGAGGADDYVAAMPIRTRKLIGTIVFVIGLTIYVLVAMVVAQLVAGAPWYGKLAYFLVAGLLWVPPAGLLIQWMQRPDPDEALVDPDDADGV